MSNLATTDNSAELYSQYSDVSIICWIWVFYVIGKIANSKVQFYAPLSVIIAKKVFVRWLYVRSK